jgi:hypothetical protein
MTSLPKAAEKDVCDDCSREAQITWFDPFEIDHRHDPTDESGMSLAAKSTISILICVMPTPEPTG